VVLTGMGQDGLRGAQQIAAAGGTVVAQDQASSVVWGMPRAVTEAGLAQRTLPLSSIAGELMRLVPAGSRKSAFA
jgi:two-component system chemotaxis response regulator CheB